MFKAGDIYGKRIHRKHPNDHNGNSRPTTPDLYPLKPTHIQEVSHPSKIQAPASFLKKTRQACSTWGWTRARRRPPGADCPAAGCPRTACRRRPRATTRTPPRPHRRPPAALPRRTALPPPPPPPPWPPRPSTPSTTRSSRGRRGCPCPPSVSTTLCLPGSWLDVLTALPTRK